MGFDDARSSPVLAALESLSVTLQCGYEPDAQAWAAVKTAFLSSDLQPSEVSAC